MLRDDAFLVEDERIAPRLRFRYLAHDPEALRILL